jgi:hypothetical protein
MGGTRCLICLLEKCAAKPLIEAADNSRLGHPGYLGYLGIFASFALALLGILLLLPVKIGSCHACTFDIMPQHRLPNTQNRNTALNIYSFVVGGAACPERGQACHTFIFVPQWSITGNCDFNYVHSIFPVSPHASKQLTTRSYNKSCLLEIQKTRAVNDFMFVSWLTKQ